MDTIHITHNKHCDDMHIKYDLYYPEDVTLEQLNNEQSSDSGKLEFADRLSEFKIDYSTTIDEIERLTNHADGYDYAIAVSAGVLSGAIDAFFVGEWDFKSAKAISNREMNEKVQKFAKKQGLEAWVEKKNASPRTTKERDAKRLETAIEFLEEKFPLPGDNTWNGSGASISTKSHHLDDPAHHPTIVGLLYSIWSQFSETATYINRESDVVKLKIKIDKYGMLEGKTPSAKIASGFLNWCIGVAKNRKGHLYSDMAGSKKTAGKGMGLPGTLMSMLKELSVLPAFQDSEFSEKLYKAYVHGIGSEKKQVDLKVFNALFEGADSKFDLRTENAVKHELNRQAVPIVINEIIVRCCYFIRHLIVELKKTDELASVNWKSVLPFRNRTIVRMMTISLGVFEVMDLGIAAIQAATKSGAAVPTFAAAFVLRVNLVGIGRFTLTGITDISMGARKKRLEVAVSSGDVAFAAAETVSTINNVKELQEKTRNHLNDITAEIAEVSNLVF